MIKTDQKALTHLDDQRLSTPWQHRALTKLLGLNYKIIYKKGHENKVADALSRQVHQPHEDLCAMSSCTPTWMEEIMEEYLKDKKVSKLVANLAVQGKVGSFTLQQGVIQFKDRIWLPSTSVVKHKILQALHSSATGGHSGFAVTYHRVKRLFAWPRMKGEIKEYVASCDICQQAKPERVKYPGLLQPLSVPDGAWRDISMDFVEGIPKASGYSCIMVVVDRFSKYAHFVPLAHPFTATTVANAYMNNIYKLHGRPKSIVSDRDKVFLSKFWQELFRLIGTELNFSTPYHPETDGQTERVNQCLEGYLRCFVHGCPHKWLQWLPLAEFWYNTTKHSSLDKTPFEVVYGREPVHMGIDRLESCAIPDVEEWLREREQMRDVLQQHLTRVQLRMKHQADKRRTERQFKSGDLVYMKLQPYIQKSVATRANQKLSFRYYGPYEVKRSVGRAAYELMLPEKARIHPVLQVSQLKKAIKPSDRVQKELPDHPDNPCEPERVLQSRNYSKHNGPGKQLLIQWTGMGKELATWEDEQELKTKFPAASAWGQAESKEEGNVMSLKIAEDSKVSGELHVQRREEERPKEARPAQAQPRRSKRGPVPSRLYASSSWTK